MLPPLVDKTETRNDFYMKSLGGKWRPTSRGRLKISVLSSILLVILVLFH